MALPFEESNACFCLIERLKKHNGTIHIILLLGGKVYEHSHEKILASGFLTRFDTNLAVQPQKIARGLKFRV